MKKKQLSLWYVRQHETRPIHSRNPLHPNFPFIRVTRCIFITRTVSTFADKFRRHNETCYPIERNCAEISVPFS